MVVTMLGPRVCSESGPLSTEQTEGRDYPNGRALLLATGSRAKLRENPCEPCLEAAERRVETLRTIGRPRLGRPQKDDRRRQTLSGIQHAPRLAGVGGHTR